MNNGNNLIIILLSNIRQLIYKILVKLNEIN